MLLLYIGYVNFNIQANKGNHIKEYQEHTISDKSTDGRAYGHVINTSGSLMNVSTVIC